MTGTTDPVAITETTETTRATEYEPITLTVNGSQHILAIDPTTPLLYVLRNDLGLTAAKFGCGLEQCGACTVVVGGEAVMSCRVPVSTAAGSEVLTIEGLDDVAGLGAVREAFLAENAGQCGYCIPGIVMRVAALLSWNESPDDATLRAALSEHLCRCGTHLRILGAAKRAASMVHA